MLKDSYTIYIQNYDRIAIKDGLKALGYNIEDFDDSHIEAILSKALGFIDFADPKKMKEIMES